MANLATGPQPSSAMGAQAGAATPVQSAIVKAEAIAAEYVEVSFASGSRRWFRWNYFGNAID